MTSKDRVKHLPKSDLIVNPENPKIYHFKDAKRNQRENSKISNENEQDRKRKRNRSKDRLDQHSTKRSRTISPIRYIPRSNKREDCVKVKKANHYHHYDDHLHRPKINHINLERMHSRIKQSTNRSSVKHNVLVKTQSNRLENQRKTESPLHRGELDKTPPATSASSISLPLSSCQCSCNCYLNLDEELEEGEIYCKQSDHASKNHISDLNCNNEKSETPKRNVSISQEESPSSKISTVKTQLERHSMNNHDRRRNSSRKEYSENLSNQNLYSKFGRNKKSASGYGDDNRNNNKNRKKSSIKQQKKSAVKSRIGCSSQRSSPAQCVHFPSSKNSSRFQMRRDRHSSLSHSFHEKMRKSTFEINKRSVTKNTKDEKFSKRYSVFEKRPNIVPLRSRNICSTPSKSDSYSSSSSNKSKVKEKSRTTNTNYQRKRQLNNDKSDKKDGRHSISNLDAVLSRSGSSHKTKYNDRHSVRQSISKTTNRFELSMLDSKALPEKNKHQTRNKSSSSQAKRESSSSSSTTSKNKPSSRSTSSSGARSDKINQDSDHSNKKKTISEKNETESNRTQHNNVSIPVENNTPENITATITTTTTTTNSEKLDFTETLKSLQIMEKRPKLHLVSKYIQIQMLKEARTCRKFCGDSLYQKLQDMLHKDSVPTPTHMPVYHRDRTIRLKYVRLPTTTNLDLQTYVPLQLPTKLTAQMHKLQLLSEALFCS